MPSPSYRQHLSPPLPCSLGMHQLQPRASIRAIVSRTALSHQLCSTVTQSHTAGRAPGSPGDSTAAWSLLEPAKQLEGSGQLQEGRGSPNPSKGHGGFNGSLCAAPNQLY